MFGAAAVASTIIAPANNYIISNVNKYPRFIKRRGYLLLSKGADNYTIVLNV